QQWMTQAIVPRKPLARAWPGGVSGSRTTHEPDHAVHDQANPTPFCSACLQPKLFTGAGSLSLTPELQLLPFISTSAYGRCRPPIPAVRRFLANA
ncbi:MAG: hypothetical protein MO852_01925, partial [Candidatus Devosia euplotis]|nr:hypothetical protein [Candidatus Devosia euplotis]